MVVRVGSNAIGLLVMLLFISPMVPTYVVKPTLITSSNFELTWTCREDQIHKTLSSGDEITGDQITIHASFGSGLGIERIEWGWSLGSYEIYSGDLVVPTSGYNPLIDDLDLDEFAWVQIDIIAYQYTRITLDWVSEEGQFDCDLLAWWADTDNSSWAVSNNLFHYSLLDEQKPKLFTFYPPRTSTLSVAIFDNSTRSGQYSVTYDTTDFWLDTMEGSEVEIPIGDYLIENSTIFLEFHGFTQGGIQYTETFSSIIVNCEFSPVVTWVQISGSTYNPLITWSAYDRNEDEDLSWSLYISTDEGDPYDRIATGDGLFEYEWDASEYPFQEYIVRVIVYDWYENRGTGYSDPFYAGMSVIIEVNSPPDRTILAGSSGLSISWTPNCDETLEYEINRDGLLIEDGIWNEGDIVVSLDGLSVGTHSFSLILLEPNEQIEKTDTVYVYVTSASSGSNTNEGEGQNNSAILWGISIGVTAGSIALIALVGFLIIQARRKGDDDEYQYQYSFS